MVCSTLMALVQIGVAPSPAAAAPVTAVKGEACSYFVKVGLFGGPQTPNGCNEGTNSDNTGPPRAPAGGTNTTDGSYSPHVRITGAGGSMSATDANGAKAVYGPAVIHGGRWPCAETGDRNCAASGPASGPQAASTTGSAAAGTVSASADISLYATPPPVGCYPGYGPNCYNVGGFGPFPVEGDSLHVQCSATDTSVSGSTTFSNALLATTTDADGEPLDQEEVPDNPPVNYTRHGVITNVGDVFSVVYNEQIVNPDGSLTVNAVHMYLFGPVAVGEVIRGQVTCGTTPTTVTPSDTVNPTCGTPVVKPVSPEDQTPQVPRSELVGTFDAGGIQSVTNVQILNGTVTVGDPTSVFPYLNFVPGQKGPLPVTATRTEESLPMYWSFDVTDTSGNTTHCVGKVPVPAGVAFHPLTPARILDSRPSPNTVGPFATPWVQGQVRDVTVTGVGSVPANAAAVVLNVTVTGTTGAGFLSMWPKGQPQPLVSSLNWAPGQTIPNAVTVKVGDEGKVSVFNAVGQANVIIDVVGYYDTLAGDGFTPLTPARILDSRPAPNTVGPFSTPWGGPLSRNVTVTGGGVPLTATAVVLNVTVTNTTAAGFLTIWPAGQAQPLASSLNWAPGDTIPNAVTVKVGTGGAVSVFNAVGQANVIIDVVGYFAAGSGQLFHPISPGRLQDSRPAGPQVGPFGTPWGPNVSRNVQVTGRATPATATAVLLNVTVTSTTAGSFLTIWPAGETAPLASSLNWAPGQTIPNAVTSKLGATGAISVKNAAGDAHVLADVAGWYGP
jgi:hypothetical protein